MKKAPIILFTLLVVLALLTGCQSKEKKIATEAFNSSVETLEQKNEALDTLISKSETLIKEDKPILNADLIPELETAATEAKAKKVSAPEISKTVEEINQQTETINAVDYEKETKALKEKISEVEKSIKQYELVNNPDEKYVIACLKKVKDIDEIAAVTEDNDPNGSLNKAGGYTSSVFFTSKLVDQSLFDEKDVVKRGTTSGGSIEVYANEDDAKKRDEYLSAFDGTFISSGSHRVVGTLIIRTSDELKASQQKALENSIISALTDIS